MVAQFISCQSSFKNDFAETLRDQIRVSYMMNHQSQLENASQSKQVTARQGQGLHGTLISREDTTSSVTEIRAVHLPKPQRSVVSSCTCACHTRRCLQSRKPSYGILGIVFVSYSGSLSNCQVCTAQSCRDQARFTVDVGLLFRGWLYRGVSASISISKSEHELGARMIVQSMMQRRVTLRLAMNNDIQGLKNLLETQAASPDDSHCIHGTTCLQVNSFSVYPAFPSF